MSIQTFQWNVTGDDTQSFVLGNIRQINKQQIFDTTYAIENLQPGVPYTMTANIKNRYTNETTSYNPMNTGNIGETIWFESNIDGLLFTKEHSKLYNIVPIGYENDNIIIEISHDMPVEYIDGFSDTKFKFDIFAEPQNSPSPSICLNTYEMESNNSYSEFAITDVESNLQYNIYYSMLVNENDTKWLYMHSHVYVGNIQTIV
jgi:hypothetical protein